MTKLLTFFVGIVIFIWASVAALVPMILIILAGSFFGGLGAWIVGWVFGDTILSIFAVLGLHGFTMWQIGIFLGFFGSYFRTTISTSK